MSGAAASSVAAAEALAGGADVSDIAGGEALTSDAAAGEALTNGVAALRAIARLPSSGGIIGTCRLPVHALSAAPPIPSPFSINL